MGKEEIKGLHLLAEDNFGRKRTLIYETGKSYPLDELLRDLKNAQVEIRQIFYEEVAEIGMQFVKGSISMEELMEQYDSLKCSGTKGMEYRMDCVLQGIAFELNAENDKEGYPEHRLQLICSEKCPVDLLTILRE